MNKFILSLIIVAACIIAPSAAGANAQLGEAAPEFTLTDSNNQPKSLSDYKGKYVVLEWFNPECPFVRKHYDSGNMQDLQEKFTAEDVVWLSIDSSAEGKQGHLTPEEAKQYIQEKNTKSTAVLLDSTGEVGKMYGAQTTPHMFIIDPAGTVIYQGAIDDMPSTDPEDVALAENYVAEMLDAALQGNPVEYFSTKSYGCSVKY